MSLLDLQSKTLYALCKLCNTGVHAYPRMVFLIVWMCFLAKYMHDFSFTQMCFHSLEAVLFIAVLYGMAFGQGILLVCAFVCVMCVEVDCAQTYTTHLHPAHACTSFAMVYWTMYKGRKQF